jgi:cell wall assembly regulator SMI1
MKDIVKRFEDWLEKHANHLLDDLNEGVESQEVFESIERIIGTDLPKEFKQFYSLHDGQFSESEDRLFGVEELYSIERMITEQAKLKKKFYDGEFDDYDSEPEAGIRSEWYNPYWLPITCDGKGNYNCIDFAPTMEGELGQIIRVQLADPKRKIVGKNFLHWFETYLEALERGAYVYSEKWGGMVYKTRSETYQADEEEDMWGNDDEEEGEEMEGFEIIDETDLQNEEV